MKTEILISCDDWENRVAVLEEGALAEIYFEREEKVIGSIYKGKVENVLPGMGACFVNIGLGRNAFLYVDDILRDPINIGETEITDRRRGSTVGELLRVGDDVLVQIVKEPRGLKGARVSTNISLPGRYLVLMPTGRYSGVSSRLEDAHERDRLKQIMRRVRPEGMATIVRTAAQGVSEAELIADLGVQLRLWHGILDSYKRAAAPALLHKDLNLVFKAVRDFMTSDVEQVVIDSKEQFEEIRSTMSLLGPQYLRRLKLWEGPANLFESRGIDEELQKLLKPKIQLPSGGHLVIEHTEALSVVDVNTGKFVGGRNLEDTLVRTNIEAAAEIARQVRLRDIGGIIVVDFIDMAHERSRQQVIDTLTAALKRDRTRCTIQAFSNLGLLEFTRKRVGKDLSGQLRSDCPYCGGLGDVMSAETLAIGLLRRVRDAGSNGSRGRKFDLVVDPSVATQLAGWYRDAFEKLVEGLKIDVRFFVESHRHREQPLLEPARRQPQPLAVGKTYEAELLSLRMPDPAAGVAVVDGNLVEIRDGANGAGQTLKLKISSIDGVLARAELSEPLRAAKRRRVRGRGKAAVEAEEPPAPPPLERPSVSAAAYGYEEEVEAEEQRPRARPVAAGRRRGGRVQAEPRGVLPPPMIVGGEGDIDYEEDESVVVVAPQAAGGPRRRRGRKVETEFAAPLETKAQFEAEADEATVPLADVGDEGEAVEEAPPARRRRYYGPIRQIYGAPLEVSEPQEQRVPAARRKAPSVRPSSAKPQASRPSVGRSKPAVPADDLEVVVAPHRPASLPIELQAQPYRGRSERGQVERGPVERGRPERGRPERGRPERGRRRESKPSAPRTGPSVRQLYPPPDLVEEPRDEVGGASPPGAVRRGKPSRGPIMRDPSAPPLPKGKVRQLYPPPEPGALEEIITEPTLQPPSSSLFVRDEQELEERRLRARERAQLRESADATESSGEPEDEA